MTAPSIDREPWQDELNQLIADVGNEASFAQHNQGLAHAVMKLAGGEMTEEDLAYQALHGLCAVIGEQQKRLDALHWRMVAAYKAEIGGAS